MNFNQDFFHVEYIRTKDAFSALRDEWNELLAHSMRDNPFLTHQWLEAWWEFYGKQDLLVITVRDNTHKLIGCLPLYRTKYMGILPVSILRFVGNNKVSSDFVECIAINGSEERVYKECIKAVMDSPLSWDILLLRDVLDGSRFHKYMMNAGLQDLETFMDPGKVCPCLSLPSSWSVLLDGLSKKVKQRIGYHRRALDRLGQVELELLTDSGSLALALDDVVRLRNDRLDQKGLASQKVTRNYVNFHRNVMHQFLMCDRLRLFFLKINGLRVAYLYSFAGADCIYFYQTGFDKLWSRYSVGFVLLGMVLQRSIEDGVRHFEFLRGDERYKYEWGNVYQQHLVDLVVYRPTLASWLWRMSLNTVNITKKTITKWLRP